MRSWILLCLSHEAANSGFFLLEKFDNFLDRSQFPNDVDHLKDLLMCALQELEELKKKIEILSETIEYQNGQLSVLRRFQYGQRSERLKKKRFK